MINTDVTTSIETVTSVKFLLIWNFHYLNSEARTPLINKIITEWKNWQLGYSKKVQNFKNTFLLVSKVCIKFSKQRDVL